MKGGWQVRALGEVCEVIAGQSPNGNAYNDRGDGLPCYQGKKEFTDKHIGAPTTWTTEVTKVAEAGDILMSVRALVGPINLATERACNCSQAEALALFGRAALRFSVLCSLGPAIWDPTRLLRPAESFAS